MYDYSQSLAMGTRVETSSMAPSARDQQARLEQLGMNIRVLRTRRDLASDKLASAIGMDRAYLWKVERGRTNATTATLMRIADGLDVPVTELLEGV